MKIEVPDWSKRIDHIKRSIRYSGETDIFPEWANEAYLDENAVVFDPDYASISGRGIRTVGFSKSAGFHITVITIIDNGHLWGASAWKANEIDIKYYEDKG